MRPDFFDSLEQQLVHATARGAGRPVRRYRLVHVRRRLARFLARTGVAATLALGATGVGTAIAVVVISSGPSAPSTTIATSASATSSQTIPAGGLVPAGFEPQSFTAITEFTWWLLGSAPCSSPPCTSIVRTVDGGASFVGLPAPPTSQVSQLRFADELDGYAFDPQLFSTHDGGETWTRVDVGGSVSDLAAADGYVYAIVWNKQGMKLMRSPVSEDDWTQLSLPAGQVSGLWVQGSTVTVDWQSPTAAEATMMLSEDQGEQFQAVGPAPPSVSCQFLPAADGTTVWAPCATGMMAGVWRSTNAGATFAGVGGDAANGSGLPAEPNSMAFAADGPDIAVAGFQQLYRTTDGGASWAAVSGLPTAQQWTYVGFSDATHGVAIGEFASAKAPTWRLYYTTDAGASYHLVPIAQ